MSAAFSIPGLGSAKPNEKLPVSNFAPDTLAAAAGTEETQNDGVSSSKGAQEKNAEDDRQAKVATEGVGGPLSEAHDAMEIDVQARADDIPPRDAGIPSTVEFILEDKTEPTGPHISDALEAALRDPTKVDSNTQPMVVEAQEEGEEGEDPGWEVDSSPYVSSSSESDSSEDSSDNESDSELLGVAEAARLLLEAAADSDEDEDGRRGRGTGPNAYVRSKNEKLENAPPKPDVTLTSADPIAPLGQIMHVVESSITIQGSGGLGGRVLDEGSILCKEDRTVVGVVSDVIGNVRHPVYVLRVSEEDARKGDLTPGTQIFYSVQHAKLVFTEALRQARGTDASNLNDEEVGDEEMEFSDDEKEQAYKRSLKEQKAKRRGGKGQNRDGDDARKSYPSRNDPSMNNGGLNYDDEEDGPYRPLARPANFGEGQLPPPVLPAGGGPPNGRRGDFRGNRGNRGHRGRGGHGGRGRNHSEGYSLPPRNHQSPPVTATGPSSPPVQWPFPPPPPPNAFPFSPPATTQAASPPQINFNFPYQGWPQGQAQQPQPQPQSPYSQTAPPPPSNYHQPLAWSGSSQTPPAGAVHVNPAFFGTSQPAQSQGQPSWAQQQHPYNQNRRG